MSRKPSPQPATQSGSSQCTRCISRSVLPRSTCAPPAGPSRNCSIAKRARSVTEVVMLAAGVIHRPSVKGVSLRTPVGKRRV